MAVPELTTQHSQNGNGIYPTAPTPVDAPEVDQIQTETPDGSPPKPDVQAPAPKSPRRRPSLPVLALAGAGLIAGCLLGVRWWAYTSTHETTDDAQLQGHLYPISSRIPGTVVQVAQVLFGCPEYSGTTP
jgi:membrane fusion protein (multidrug efflux system)